MNLVQLADSMYKADWHEPAGTCVSLYFDLARRIVRGTIFFPQWIAGEVQHPEKTICYQSDFIDDMHRFRDEIPRTPTASFQSSQTSPSSSGEDWTTMT